MPDEKQKKHDELRGLIVAMSAKATDEDRALVKRMIARANTGEYGAEVFAVTAGAAAILFLEYNPHNRDWAPIWSQELARRMAAGLWRKNNECPGFYNDGVLEDGQHRFAALALAGFTWTTVMVFGIERDSIMSVDAGRRRDAASALKMDGMAEAVLKQQIVKTAATYLKAAGQPGIELRSEMEIGKAVLDNNGALEQAIEIAEASMQNITSPVFTERQGATAAYLMLTHDWPPQRVREKLALFQTGVGKSESDPIWVASDIIKKARETRGKRERLSATKEIGLCLFGMKASEEGAGAVNRTTMRAAIKGKQLPKADYPEPMPAAAD